MNSPEVSGFLFIDKSCGITSFGVVKKIRHLVGKARVGHAGTLDPLATGLLALVIGQATQRVAIISSLEKEYDFKVRWGLSTDTDDIEGRILEERPTENVTPERIRELLERFRGSFKQKPPQFSAVKIKGTPAYDYARRGITVDLAEKEVKIRLFELLGMEPPFAHFRLVCSRGTYVRSLARDMGKLLGCGGCVSEIRRLRIGPFKVEDALPDGQISPSHLQEKIWTDPQVMAAVSSFQEGAASSC